MLLINNQEQLNEIIKHLALEPVIGIDTEFIRRDSYFAKLALIQISTANDIFIIDPVSLDIEPFRAILAATNVIKIIHSARQDFEIFYHIFKELPKNIFDTQIAATICGIGKDVSYAKLCLDICEVTLDKSEQVSNWLLRPLSCSMLEYAKLDVYYLFPIYNHLLAKLIADDNILTLQEQIKATLLDKKLYSYNVNNIIARMKNSNKTSDILETMQLLVAFREEQAIYFDVPRRFIAADEQLAQIARILPRSHFELNRVRGLSKWLRDPEIATKLCELCLGVREIKTINRIL